MDYHRAARSLAFLCFALGTSGCNNEIPVLTLDAGRSDAGRSDAGRSDAGRSDAGAEPDPSTCAGYAELLCEWMERCYPVAPWVLYRGGMPDCIAQRTARCEYERALPDVGQLADPAACVVTLVASCSPPFVIPACVPEPGGRSEGEPCRAHEQCGLASDERRMRCVGASGGDCDDGTCQPAIAEHGACVHSGNVAGLRDFGDPCDVDAGFRCVSAYDASAPDRSADDTTCEPMRHGVLGEPCAPGTSYECRAPDLACDPRIFECVAAPVAGEPCGPDVGILLCRQDLPLSCDGSVCVEVSLRYAGEACAPGELCPRPDGECPSEGVCPSDPAPGGACTTDDDCAYYERCDGVSCAVEVRPECP